MIKHLKGISDEELEDSILNTDELIDMYLSSSYDSVYEKKLLRIIDKKIKDNGGKPRKGNKPVYIIESLEKTQRWTNDKAPNTKI